jgi:flagellar L-ring protein precursor FlgH
MQTVSEMIRRPMRLLASASITMLATLNAPLGASLPAQAAPAQPPTTGAAAAATTPAPARRPSWTSDRREFTVGDLVTVYIDDYTITTALKENSASDTRTRDLSATARWPGNAKGVGLDVRNDAEHQQRGSARRENRFQNEMSVRVVAIGPNGVLQLKGTKNINVDKNQQDIVFTGFARPQDISLSNTVESSRIADAQVGYASPGNLAQPKTGFISRILGGLWP